MPPAARLRTVFSTISRLGVAGIGGPAARLAERIAERHGPARVLAGGDGDGGLPPGTVQTIRRPVAWRLVERTRLARRWRPSQAALRVAFDAAAAARLPPCDALVAENSTSLVTLRRARREHGSRTVLLQHNHPFPLFREALLEERRRWGGPEPFITADLAARSTEEVAEADVVVCLSESTRRAFAATGVPAERLRRARLGVDGERFRPAPCGDRAFVVAFVGWLSLRKGYPYLVEAFRRAALPGARLVLHGGTDDPFDHSLVARLRGDADVAVTRGPVEETYRRASVCVLPSVSDGFGLSGLEAMACGIPVVVTDACGVAECVDDGNEGFVVPTRDVDALADRLQRLHGDAGLRMRMGAAGRARAVTRPWSAYQDDLSEILAEVTVRLAGAT